MLTTADALASERREGRDGAGVLPDDSAFEPHFRIGELAKLWKIGRETIRLLVKDDPCVIKIRRGRKKRHTTYSVPASVAVRIHTKLLNPESNGR